MELIAESVLESLFADRIGQGLLLLYFLRRDLSNNFELVLNPNDVGLQFGVDAGVVQGCQAIRT